MNSEQFQEIKLVENTHFWYKARREIIEEGLKSHKLLEDNLSVLEIGSANGTNIEYFKKYYNKIKGSEINEEALNIAKHKNPEIQFVQGALPFNIGFGDEQFDVIFLFDVLEHVEDDTAALNEIYKRLKLNGTVVLTVPAYQFLFGAFDKLSYHFRRYNNKTLSKKLENANFKILMNSYFNFWLFPVILILRLMEKISKPNKPKGSKLMNPVINMLFYKIMKSEKLFLSKKIRLPLGSSIITLANKE